MNLAQSAVERYRFDIGAFPPDVETLVALKYLPTMPKGPHADGTYVITAGGVVTYKRGS